MMRSFWFLDYAAAWLILMADQQQLAGSRLIRRCRDFTSTIRLTAVRLPLEMEVWLHFLLRRGRQSMRHMRQG